jgi:hypothetical protein
MIKNIHTFNRKNWFLTLKSFGLVGTGADWPYNEVENLLREHTVSRFFNKLFSFWSAFWTGKNWGPFQKNQFH